jgi:hypothetical protein
MTMTTTTNRAAAKGGRRMIHYITINASARSVLFILHRRDQPFSLLTKFVNNVVELKNNRIK